MATPTLEELKKQIEELARQTGTKGIQVADIENIKQAQVVLKGLRAELKDMSSDLGFIRDAFKDSVNELSKQNTYITASKTALKSISSISSQILEHQKGESALTIDQIKKLQHKGSLQFKELELAIKRGTLNKKEILELKVAEASRKLFNAELERTLNIEGKVNKEIGLVGTGLQGLAKFMNQLGFADLSQPFKEAIEQTKNARRELIGNSDQIDEINEKLKTQTNLTQEEREDLELTKKSLEDSNTELQKQSSKYKNILSAIGKQLTLTNLLDFAITKIVQGFLNVNKASVEFQRLTGQNAVAVGSMNTRFATTVDFLKTASELTQQIGFNAISIFGPDQLAAIAEAKNLLGLSAEEAGNLALQSKLSANTVDSFQDNMLSAVDATNRLTKSAVAPGVILKDVLNTSKGISLSLGNNPERLGKAATAARAFGMELKQVDSIANSLLNFESSIEAELEAQLLTGKNINLAKARELALTNDLEGLSAELAKNGATAAEFAGMNRIAQEALAKSVGMSRDDLAKSIMLQESSKNLSDEQRAAVLGVTKEQLQQVDIQERLNKSIDKLAQAFAPVLEALVPVVDLLGKGLQLLTYMTYPITELIKWGNSFGKVIGTVVAGLTAAGIAALVLNSSLTFGVGTAIALTAAGAGIAFLKSNSTKVGDLNSPADGKTVVSTKEGGLFQLSPNDDLIAAPGASAAIQSAQSEGGITTMSMQPLIAEIQSMKQELKAVLTTIANKEGVIQMDSDIVGKALVLGSVRV